MFCVFFFLNDHLSCYKQHQGLLSSLIENCLRMKSFSVNLLYSCQFDVLHNHVLKKKKVIKFQCFHFLLFLHHNIWLLLNHLARGILISTKSSNLSPDLDLHNFWPPHNLAFISLFVCVEVFWPNQPNGVMSSAISSPNYTFTGQA